MQSMTDHVLCSHTCWRYNQDMQPHTSHSHTKGIQPHRRHAQHICCVLQMDRDGTCAKWQWPACRPLSHKRMERSDIRSQALPKLPGLEREAVSWFTHVYPLTQREDWPTTKPIDIIQVRLPVFVITSRLRGVFSCVVWEAELSAGLCILCNQPH